MTNFLAILGNFEQLWFFKNFWQSFFRYSLLFVGRGGEGSKNCFRLIFSPFQAILNNFDFFCFLTIFLGTLSINCFWPIFSPFHAILNIFNFFHLTTNIPVPYFILFLFLGGGREGLKNSNIIYEQFSAIFFFFFNFEDIF